MSFARHFIDKFSKSLLDKGIDVSKNFVSPEERQKILDELRLA